MLKNKERKNMTCLGNHKLIGIVGEWHIRSSLREGVCGAVNITLKGLDLILEVMGYH